MNGRPSLAQREATAPPDTLTVTPADARSVLARHTDHTSAFLALNEGTLHFRVPSVDGFIAYRESRGFLIQFGGVWAAPDQRARLLAAFLDHARHRRRRVVALQLCAGDLGDYLSAGFTVNQLGTSYGRSLEGLTLSGKSFVKLRNKLSRARRAGVVVAERSPREGRHVTADLAHIDGAWLRGKGRGVAPLTFLVGQLGTSLDQHRRLFTATLDGEPIAYQTFSPVYGPHAGFLHDLSRRLPDAPPGTAELVIHTALETFRSEQVGHLHFGLSPFCGLAPEHEVDGHSPALRRFATWLHDHGHRVYPAQSQLAYKEKWQPDLSQPEYIAFQGGVSLRGVWQVLRLVNAVALP